MYGVEVRQRVIALFSAKNSVIKISKETGIPCTSIYGILYDAKLMIPKVLGPKKNKNKEVLTVAQAKQEAVALENPKDQLDEIINKLGKPKKVTLITLQY